MSSDSLTRNRTIWTLNSRTKPFTWDTTSTPFLSGDPFDFDDFVLGERILDIPTIHEACNTRVHVAPDQWTDDDATGIEIEPPPVFPIVDHDGEEDTLSADEPECPSLRLPSSHQPLAEDINPPDQLSDDDEYDSERDYPDDWDDDWYGPVDVLSDDPIPPRQYPEPVDNTKSKHSLDTIKRFVAAQFELPQSSRVDTIILGDPLYEDFKSVDGLTFKHLKLEAGVTEEVDLTPVAHLSTSWSAIESVFLSGVCTRLVYDRTPYSGTVTEQWTAIPLTIKSLQLDLATASFDFRHPKGGFRSLENLKLVDNYAVDLFCKAWSQLPNFTTQIKNLHVISTNTCDLTTYKTLDFRRRLRACKNVTTLLLALDFTTENNVLPKPEDPDTKLADCIPSSVHNLSFHFSRTDAMLEDLNNWVEMAHNPAWLPHLRCIRLNTDAKGHGYKYIDHSKLEDCTPFVENPQFAAKIQMIYDALLQRSPPVRILEWGTVYDR